MKNELFMNELCRIAQKAGDAILRYYGQAIDVERKADCSPVTEADRAAHDVIVAALAELCPEIPVISEEHTHHELPAGATRFFLVDPLDGTKSFIRGDGEFTVNIGLIEEDVPTLGVIYVPCDKQMYAGAEGVGAWREWEGRPREIIHTRTVPPQGMSALVSFSHKDAKTDGFLEAFSVARRDSASSSLKFCRVAEGAADIYPRFGPTMEWDTAAGHAIVRAAGGRMEKPDGSHFGYSKPEFRNGPFVVFGQ